MKVTAWQDAKGCWHARDFKWFTVGYGATRDEAIKDLERKIALLEAEEESDAYGIDVGK